MNWNLEDDSLVEQEEVKDAKTYVARKGITHDPLGLRIEPGEVVPSKVLEDEEIFQWLLTKRAIKEVK